MSEGGTRAQFASSYSNEYNNDTSSVHILLDTESQKKTKYRKIVIGLGVAVICFAILVCIIFLSSKPNKILKLIPGNDTGSNSSSNQKTSKNTGNRGKGMNNKECVSHKY